MWRNLVGPIFAALSTALAVTASLSILFLEKAREEIAERPGILVFYFFPVLFSLAGLQASRYATPAGKAWLVTAAGLLLLFCILFLFTIGFLFFPAFLALAVAALAHVVLARSARR